MRPLYRIKQFLSALHPDDRLVTVETGRFLSEEQTQLFQGMPAVERGHAVAVLQTLQRTGPVDLALGQAALLHDIGKTGGRIRLWHRVAVVLLQACWPEALGRLQDADPSSWRYPFYVELHHAELGALMAARAGADDTAVRLIAHHHSMPETQASQAERDLQARLQAADEAN
ncbi:MAG TPA: HDIG domain-containing protein [Anaerolineae bacterium]|nr:HDIG domain-containing protein [Anaerolineae bacterium]HNT05786.1 HDIG domain-containing protein [Anaerolineae bacterium]